MYGFVYVLLPWVAFVAFAFVAFKHLPTYLNHQCKGLLEAGGRHKLVQLRYIGLLGVVKARGRLVGCAVAQPVGRQRIKAVTAQQTQRIPGGWNLGVGG